MSPRPGDVWRALFAASVLIVGAADAVVLDLTKSYFSSGYNGFALQGFGDRAMFFASAAVLDVGMLAAVWFVVLAIARALRARPLRALAWAGLVGVAFPLAFDLALHRLHRVLGDVLELGLMLDLAAGSWSAALGEAAQDLPPLILLAAGACVASLVLAWLVFRLEHASAGLAAAELPRGSRLALAAVACVFAGGSVLGITASRAPAIEFGLAAKPAGRVIADSVDALTDFDRDGVGWLSRPGDPAPFDAGIHPWALEIPGNGVDENGLAGDLPIGFEISQPISVPTPRPRPGAPSVLLIFLESFRADLVGLRERGREVTPNINALAASGTHSERAFAHVPVTWASRASLMQGRVVPTAHASTLVDDFLARGYEVAWFSGQHDGIREGDARLGTDRVSFFYDARQDADHRTSRSKQPISLQVSWKTVVSRVRAYLDGRAPDVPLFLYVNLVDTHFPYWHSQMDDILGGREFQRSGIRPENREAVWKAYLNAAANVDEGVGGLVTLADARLGPETVVLVTGDHGEAFYEHGLLGHGQALDEEQTRVPFAVRRIRSAVPDPLALSDARGLLGHWISAEPIAQSEIQRASIFQSLGESAHPRAIATRSKNHLALMRLAIIPDRGRSEPWRTVALTWETLRLGSAEPSPREKEDAAPTRIIESTPR